MSLNRQRLIDKTVATMLHYYSNHTSKIQIIRVTDSQNITLEKMVFPQQRILFEAMPEAELEIYHNQSDRPKIVQIIPCHNLGID